MRRDIRVGVGVALFVLPLLLSAPVRAQATYPPPATQTPSPAYPPPQPGAYPPPNAPNPPAEYPNAAPQAPSPSPAPANAAYPPGAYPSSGIYGAPGSYPPPAPPPAAVSAGAPPPMREAPPRRHVFLAMPLLGLHAVEGYNGGGLDAGIRIGGMLGARIGPFFSINGELTADVLNPKNVQPGESLNSYQAILTVSPLLHVHEGPVELVIGPKLGVFGYMFSDTPAGGDAFNGHGSGWAVGANAGAFVALGPAMSIGGMLSFESLSYRQNCGTVPGGTESCSPGFGPADPVIGVTGALLF